MNELRRGACLLLLLSLSAIFCTQLTFALGRPPLLRLENTVLVPENDDVSLRLPNNTIPISYDVFLTTRIDEEIFTYNGAVDIHILCLEATSNIVLHNRLSVISKIVLKSGQTEVELTEFETNVDTEFLIIQLTSPLVVNQQYTLSISFVGEHTDNNIGWYRASYTNDKGEVVWFATTKFEAPEARQAFPCYDEPDKKAVFRFEITNNQKYHAISNMPIATKVTNEGDNTVTTTFQDTPIMPTYMMAFVVSDYERICEMDTKNREQCVYARPNAMHLAPWGLKTAVQGLLELEKLLNVDYTLPKMDQIAIPEKYYGSGATENWGLVAYREDALLIDADSSKHSYTEKGWIASIIVHEFAHQWFGNLVSPKWWTYLWLNEALATLFMYYGTHKVYPDMRFTDLMVLEIHEVLVYDAEDDPRPMTHYVESNLNIRRLFNYVSYEKAATVLRMMMLALGDDTFYKGLQYYLEEMNHKSAVAEDLFRGFQKAADESKALPEGLRVETILNSWTLQGGYPLITANRYSEAKVTLKQFKFTISNPTPPASNFYIPITYTESRGVAFNSLTTQDWFRGDAASHELPISAQSSWYILNKQQSSFYRVNYDENNWRQLALTLNSVDTFENIHLLNRAQLLDDSLELALNSRLNATIAFDVLRYLTYETDYLPWAAAESGLKSYYARFSMSDSAEVFNAYLVNMTSKLYDTYGAVSAGASEVYLTHLARNLAIGWACRVGSESCQEDASKLFAEHLEKGTELDLNYNHVLPCAGARKLTEDSYNRLLQRLDASTSTIARTAVIDTLLCTYEADFLENLLTLIVAEASVASDTEKLYVISQLGRRDVQGLEMVMEFLMKNTDLVTVLISTENLATIFKQIAQATYSVKLAAELKVIAKWFESSLGNEVISEIEASLASNLLWIDKEGDMIIAFLTADGEPDSANGILESTILVVMGVLVTLFCNFYCS